MKKRLLSLLLISVLLVGLFVGCGNSTVDKPASDVAPEKSDASDEAPATSSGEVLPLTVELFDRANTPEGEGTLEDNRWTQWIKEEMLERGVDVTFVPVPRGEEATKLNVLLASNSAPDISFTYDRLMFTKYAADGGLTPLDDYVEEYGQDIISAFQEDGILDYGRIDNELYAIPARRSNTFHFMSFIRKDWLDKLALEIPTTKEELEVVLQAFKDNDASGTGNTIPWSLMLEDPGDFKSHAYSQYDAMYSFFEDSRELDVTTPEPLREGFREYMGWMNSLYNKGLIDPEFATKNNIELQRQDVVSGKVGFFTEGAWTQYGTDSKAVYRHLKEIDPDAEFIPIEVFENSNGDYLKTHYPPVGLYLFVPKSAKHPEAAVKYLNWMADYDVAFTLTHGIEGEHYETIEGDIPKAIDLDYNQQTLNWIAADIKLMYNGEPPMAKEKEREIIALTAGNLGDFAIECATLADKQGFTEVLFDHELKSEKEYGPQLTSTYQEYWVKLTTSKDFEADFDEFLAEIKSKGIEKIQEERTEYYSNMQ